MDGLAGPAAAPFPFARPPEGGQGFYPGAPVQGKWNSVWPPGAGQFGWKLDVEKEIPYYPLGYSGAEELTKKVVTPLRVSERWANSMLWSIYNVHHSAVLWVSSRIWKKGRNQREAETLARVLDLAITEFGHATVEKSATFEVMLRRMWAIRYADKQGHWEQAALLEEIPSEKHPELHEVIVGKLLKTHQLIVNADSVKASSTSVNDDV